MNETLTNEGFGVFFGRFVGLWLNEKEQGEKFANGVVSSYLRYWGFV